MITDLLALQRLYHWELTAPERSRCSESLTALLRVATRSISGMASLSSSP